jgi:hypothetical protein
MHNLDSHLGTVKRVSIAILTFFLAFCQDSGVLAQNYVLDIKNMDLTDYPSIKGDVWSRDPKGMDTSDLNFIESGKKLKLTYKGKKDSILTKKNKCILFLVLNPGNTSTGRFELDWYKSVLSQSLNGSTVEDGDKIDILNFNHEFSGQILYPGSLSFTDDLSEIKNKIKSLTPRTSNPGACSNRGSLLLPAIDQAIALIKETNADMPSGIVVLSDDVVCLSNQIENLPDKSRKNNIPIYAITFSAFRSPHNSIEALCDKTFGQYYQDFASDGLKAQSSSSKLTNYLTSFLNRHKGIMYRYEWETGLPKDSKQHSVKLQYKEFTTEYSYATPGRNFIEWSLDNPLAAIGILLSLASLGFGASVYMRRQKEKQAIQEVQMEHLQKEHEVKSGELSSKILNQEKEIQQIRERTQREKMEQEEQRRTEEREKKKMELIRQMKLRGVLPTLDCIAPDRNFQFTVSKPQTTIGRNKTCDLFLNYPTVSKNHAKISFLDNAYVLEDMGSSNGTQVNNRSVKSAILKHGDVIRLGEVVINFRS